MNYDQLHTFYYVAKVLNFTKTGELLNLTQPAITARIRNLEMELSCTLFEKDRNQLFLTPKGEILLQYAEQIIHFSDKAREALSSTRDEELFVGFCPAFSYDVICKTVDHFTRENNIKLKISESYDSLSLVEEVKKQNVDLAFVRVPVYDPDLTLEQLFKDKMVLFASPRHQLSSLQFIEKHHLNGHTIITYSTKTELWKRFDKTLVGVQNLREIQVMNIQMLIKMVKEDVGFSILPFFSLIEEVEKGELKILPYEPLEDIPRDIMTIYLTRSSRAEIIKRFLFHCQMQISLLDSHFPAHVLQFFRDWKLISNSKN